MAKITFYGTRGSNSLTSDKYMEFGGATTCILMQFGDAHIMVDCGSGVSNATEALADIEELHLLVTHSHIDHMIGTPTLLSAMQNKKLHIWGKSFQGVRVQDAISRMMNQSLWPIRAETYQNVVFHEIDGPFTIGGVRISNMDSNHPGGCSLFRLEDGQDVVVTCFDFCHLNGFEEKLCRFAEGATTLIYDGCLSESDFVEKTDWGHSTPEAGSRIGKKLGCREVIITHFGVFDDEELTAWETRVQQDNPFVTFARSGRRASELTKMVALGTMLGTEKDNDKLLTQIVDTMMDITAADGGTLYLLEEKKLEFKVLITRSRKIKRVRKDAPLGIPAVDINGKNICAAAAREKELINVPDCYAEEQYDFSGTYEYDRTSGYHTKSVLVIPMIDEYNDVVGVLQLINSTNRTGDIVPFRETDETILMAIANQASMAITNSAYSQKIDDLLYGFVKVLSVGIDERTPYNANHTRNMVRFADRFFDYENSVKGPYMVEPKKRREILMGIWLHDIGKLLTPIAIMNKDSRLGSSFAALKNRFERRELLLKLFCADGTVNEAEYTLLEAKRTEQLRLITEINQVGFLSDDFKAKLDRLSEETYRELDGTEQSVITAEEHDKLSIVKGTLTKEERNIMESHVSMTQKFLSQLNFPKYYDKIPIYAGNHHEFLNGTGYPNHLTAKDLPWPCRLITVCDIFEALIAKDRPYKKPMLVEKAFSILYEMADNGQLDRNIVQEFEKTDAWCNPQELHGTLT